MEKLTNTNYAEWKAYLNQVCIMYDESWILKDTQPQQDADEKRENAAGHQGGHTKINSGNYPIWTTNWNNDGCIGAYSIKNHPIVWEMKRSSESKTGKLGQDDKDYNGKLYGGLHEAEKSTAKPHMKGGVSKKRE